ncbi:MAG: outer membrane lipoprotein chaperone LolA, partial [Steroidobacteraceae bacterium]|nr:outer membrane lipoprotein chaperone LolA [Steroidobacteraceae bacterium]
MLALLGCLALCSAAAAARNALQSFVGELQSWRADFVQQITDAQGRVQLRSNGTLLVLRPGRFRWEIRPVSDATDYSQLLVSDGTHLWFYDRELQQVTVKAAGEALGSTPAMLLAGGPDWER